MFECLSDGTYVDIRHVSLEPAEGIESETAFTGPVFAELDAELQEGFRTYIQVTRCCEVMRTAHKLYYNYLYCGTCVTCCCHHQVLTRVRGVGFWVVPILGHVVRLQNIVRWLPGVVLC